MKVRASAVWAELIVWGALYRVVCWGRGGGGCPCSPRPSTRPFTQDPPLPPPDCPCCKTDVGWQSGTVSDLMIDTRHSKVMRLRYRRDLTESVLVKDQKQRAATLFREELRTERICLEFGVTPRDPEPVRHDPPPKVAEKPPPEDAPKDGRRKAPLSKQRKEGLPPPGKGPAPSKSRAGRDVAKEAPDDAAASAPLADEPLPPPPPPPPPPVVVPTHATVYVRAVANGAGERVQNSTPLGDGREAALPPLIAHAVVAGPEVIGEAEEDTDLGGFSTAVRLKEKQGVLVKITVYWNPTLGLAPLEIRARAPAERFRKRLVVQLPEFKSIIVPRSPRSPRSPRALLSARQSGSERQSGRSDDGGEAGGEAKGYPACVRRAGRAWPPPACAGRSNPCRLRHG